MKIINRKNILPILCCTYTVISLCNAIIEQFIYKSGKNESLNSLFILAMSSIIILILSMQKKFRKLNIWVMILIQYVLFIAGIVLLIWASQFIEEINPHGYRDAIVSGTFFYIIGTIIYYISFFVQLRKENAMLMEIQNKNQSE